MVDIDRASVTDQTTDTESTTIANISEEKVLNIVNISDVPDGELRNGKDLMDSKTSIVESKYPENLDDLTRHFAYMSLSLFIGYKALLINETPVACLIKDEVTDKILSIGYNFTNISLNGTQHAELIAVKRLIDDPSINFKNLVLYVTVEPCIMCASFLRQCGIGKVIYGCGNDRFGGNGTVLSIHLDKNLLDDPYPSFGGIMRTEGIQLLRNFYIQENESAPQPKVKKNKDIDQKLFPPNEFNLTKEEFVSFYGSGREDVWESHDKEITPTIGKGYTLGDFIDLNVAKEVPFLEEEMGKVDQDQINEFFHLFYDITDEGKVDYLKRIEKYNSKKRKLSEVSEV